MQEIDQWVIAESIKRLAKARQQQPDLCFSINVTGSAFGDDRNARRRAVLDQPGDTVDERKLLCYQHRRIEYSGDDLLDHRRIVARRHAVTSEQRDLSGMKQGQRNLDLAGHESNLDVSSPGAKRAETGRCDNRGSDGVDGNVGSAVGQLQNALRQVDTFGGVDYLMSAE